MLRKRRIFAVFAAAAAAALLTGCGGGGVAGGGGSPGALPQGRPGVPAPNPAPLGTWLLTAGGSQRSGALQALAFLPDTITINEGDSVRWTVQGEAHTITFLGPFNSPPSDPTLPAGGSSYDGSAYTGSGILFPGATYTLKFPKAGTYHFACFLHPPEMVGTVVVQPKGSAYPHDQAFYDGNGANSARIILNAAQGSIESFPYGDGGPTLAAGIAPGLVVGPPSQATVLRFLSGPTLTAEVRIHVGGTITWVNQSNNEPHTVTFPAAGQPLPPINPFGPPIGGNTYDGSHVVSSTAFFPGQSYSLTFTKVGTFDYVCLLHDDWGMAGTITVLPPGG